MSRICVVTGGRADRGLLDVVIEEMRTRYELGVIVLGTGQADPERCDHFADILPDDYDDEAIAQTAGMATSAIAAELARIQPDYVMVLGDRYEILGATVAAHYLRIPIIHLHGGEDTAGSLDDRTRNAISQFADYHFVAHPLYGKKLRRMDVPGRVWYVGAPGLDSIRKDVLLAADSVELEHPFVLVSVPEGPEVAHAVAKALDVVCPAHCIWFGPNADAGRNSILPYVTCQELPRTRFLEYLVQADVIVGNSSCGIYEAHPYGTPCVNVGDRQKGRIRHESVIDVPVDVDAIVDGIQKALTMKVEGESPFATGHAAKRIADVLCTL